MDKTEKKHLKETEEDAECPVSRQAAEVQHKDSFEMEIASIKDDSLTEMQSDDDVSTEKSTKPFKASADVNIILKQETSPTNKGLESPETDKHDNKGTSDLSSTDTNHDESRPSDEEHWQNLSGEKGSTINKDNSSDLVRSDGERIDKKETKGQKEVSDKEGEQSGSGWRQNIPIKSKYKYESVPTSDPSILRERKKGTAKNYEKGE